MLIEVGQYCCRIKRNRNGRKIRTLGIADEDVTLPLKQIVRVATASVTLQQNEQDSAEALELCKHSNN